jgi:hypothetical protein
VLKYMAFALRSKGNAIYFFVAGGESGIAGFYIILWREYYVYIYQTMD